MAPMARPDWCPAWVMSEVTVGGLQPLAEAKPIKEESGGGPQGADAGPGDEPTYEALGLAGVPGKT